jgi:hypothetical protein
MLVLGSHFGLAVSAKKLWRIRLICGGRSAFLFHHYMQ